jgi:hypothetical protein
MHTCGYCVFLQVNQMLAAKRINFAPAAVEAGLMPLLKDMLAQIQVLALQSSAAR